MTKNGFKEYFDNKHCRNKIFILKAGTVKSYIDLPVKVHCLKTYETSQSIIEMVVSLSRCLNAIA